MRQTDRPLIGLAHGSRHPGVGPTIEALVAAAGTMVGVPARAAYLDLIDPDLEAVATGLATEGFGRAIVVPLLFTSAFHATVDVPATVDAAARASGLHLLVAEIGYDYSYESYIQQPDKMLDPVSIHSARLFVGETLKVTPETGATASVESFLNLNKEGKALNVNTGQPGVDEILIPSERAFRTREVARKEGILVDRKVYDALNTMAGK